MDLRSRSQFDFKTGNFVLIKLCSSAGFCNTGQEIKVFGGGGQDLKIATLYQRDILLAPFLDEIALN